MPLLKSSRGVTKLDQNLALYWRSDVVKDDNAVYIYSAALPNVTENLLADKLLAQMLDAFCDVKDLSTDGQPILEQFAQMHCTKEQKPNDKVERLHQRLNEVKDKMAENVNAVVSNGNDLLICEEKAANLELASKDFEQKSTQVKRAMCWQKYRLYIGTTIIVIVILLVLIVPIALSFSKK
jgi:hypothetical protein